jgi:thiol-disulfide isomerase/thioredoxin
MNRSNRKSRIYGAMLLCTSLLLSACAKTEYSDNHGNSGQFSDFEGRWLVINYWAVWCKPCIEEIPELNQFAKQQAETTVVLGVDFDQSSGEKLQQAVADLAIEFAVLHNDPASLLGYQRPQVLPTTLIYNPDGKLVHTLIGPQNRQSLTAAMAKSAVGQL